MESGRVQSAQASVAGRLAGRTGVEHAVAGTLLVFVSLILIALVFFASRTWSTLRVAPPDSTGYMALGALSILQAIVFVLGGMGLAWFRRPLH